MTAFFVFDFDGVLFDTARECLAVAFRAMRDQPGPAAERWGKLDAAPADLAQPFLTHRHWVGPPWQYAVLLDCLAREELPASTDEFLKISAERKAELSDFTARYFAARAELARDEAAWCAVIEPFPALQVFAQLHAGGQAAILSTRDEHSIARILARYGQHAPTQLPRAGVHEKWQILSELATQRGLSPRQVFFLDDYLHHALPARERGFAAHLALWGYLGPDDVAAAGCAGLPCLAQGELAHAITRHAQEKPS